MSAPTETCAVRCWDGWSDHTCGKPVKRDGMCGVHAAAKERRARNDAERKRQSALQHDAYVEARRIAGIVTARTGLRLSVYGGGSLLLSVNDAKEWLGPGGDA